MGIELLLHSFGNCSVIKAAGLFWASAELCVFATTEQSVRESEGLLSTSERTMEDVLSALQTQSPLMKENVKVNDR